ncbi:MAG: class I SAM-dependent methyltransferase [Alistipes sp.]|jgi:23S rRNA (cytosine1962-C5)-methyltransferase|nr:class I SAM-dependent methyltransferase [Alistipes sp.]
MIKQLTPNIPDYELLDTGDGEKLERFGKYVVRRPEPQAIWHKSLKESEWLKADASFLRDAKSEERGEWRLKPTMPSRWNVAFDYKSMHLRMRLALTSFKHVGIFPEQAANWMFIYDTIEELKSKGIERPKVLNLFAYTGGATLAARAAGGDVTHVDSVKQVVTWSRENMEQSGLDGVRWIVEDATKFVEREVRRGNKYHAILLDPPAYGRGANGEKWVLEDDICNMLECCAALLEKENAFLVFNLYSMGLSAMLARTAVHQAFGVPQSEQMGELYFEDKSHKQIPFGTYYRFRR